MEIKIVLSDREERILRYSGKKVLALASFGAVLAVGAYAYAIADTPTFSFSPGTTISSNEVNTNFDELYAAVFQLEQTLADLGNAVTVRKNAASGLDTPTGATVALAFCETDEVLTGGGCYFPPENNYDADFPDNADFFTGGFPRPLVGVTSVPVGPSTTEEEMRPRATIGDRIIPFDADLVPDESGSVTAGLGGGWGCYAGNINHDDAPNAQSIDGTMLTEGYFFKVHAYAVCMKVLSSP